MGLMLILQVIYEHEEPWWKDNDRGKLMICPPQLSGNTTKNYLLAKQEELEKKMMNFAL
jgi:hypothetical protein